jgi:two-component system sensor histidine kinase/response regulator
MTILLVDDRPENLIALQDILEKEGRTFITANSGYEALKIMLRNNEVGLIMLDVQMPEMDGFEVARLLKSNNKTKDISIIFVTAISKEEQYVLKGFEEGAVDYLQKPLDINLTRAKVNVFEHLYNYQQQLKQSLVKVEAVKAQLERFVYTVSHDLKSPLSGIVMMVNTILYELETIERKTLGERLNIVEDASMHLAQMVDSILEYSKKSYDEQKKEEVDLNELLKDIFRLLFAPGHISLAIEKELPTLYTRKLKLQQVFQNLISNAIKYNDKAEGSIEVGYSVTDRHHVFSVKDNGAGMSDEDTWNIFSLFQKGKQKSNRDSSTGIGLNVMKVIIEEQGGKIWVDSVPGQGSTFYFEWER